MGAHVKTDVNGYLTVLEGFDKRMCCQLQHQELTFVV